MILFIFPNGRFVPAWTRPLALIAFVLNFVLGEISLLLRLLVSESAVWQATAASLFIEGPLFRIGLYAQVHRYRFVTSPQERQQTKLVIAGLGLMLLAIFVWVPTVEAPLLPPGRSRLLWYLVGPIFMFGAVYVLPLSLMLSILRYRLWEIDLVIRRTLLYSLLTALLALIYFGCVMLRQRLFAGVGGGQTPFAIVLSTLAIAAVFSPLRRRLQEVIDRRFYRQKYDAARTMAAFAATARDEVAWTAGQVRHCRGATF